ncbi:hypothetical protein CVT26_011321 [Gymnopilus dilepis]|uniref:Uncharacterized protein n=1 Tax=Gymnopilus dilepis TaxID=231916 RepID=A0A409YR16_9AGAR|nr:hypothetical protein CVT26_011321 [Gymnopilus dilepis]
MSGSGESDASEDVLSRNRDKELKSNYTNPPQFYDDSKAREQSTPNLAGNLQETPTHRGSDIAVLVELSTVIDMLFNQYSAPQALR